MAIRVRNSSQSFSLLHSSVKEEDGIYYTLRALGEYDKIQQVRSAYESSEYFSETRNNYGEALERIRQNHPVVLYDIYAIDADRMLVWNEILRAVSDDDAISNVHDLSMLLMKNRQADKAKIKYFHFKNMKTGDEFRCDK